MTGVPDMAQASIERSGLHIQGVLPTLPFDPPLCYSVGFQLLDPPAPEVIVAGPPVCHASHLVRRVFEDVRAGPLELRPGAVVDLDGPGGPAAARVDPVLPQWAGRHALLAGDLLGLDPAAVPCVQLVCCDEAGRWPEDPRASQPLRATQPLLGRQDPWLVPLAHTDQEDVYLDHAAGDVVVAMPTYERGWPEGRHELLRAIRVDPGRAVVCQVPWAADYVAVGDVVEARPGDGRGGLPADALVGGAVLHRGPFTGLAYLLRPVARDEDEADRLIGRLFDALDALSADGWRARVSTTVGSVHVNSCEPEAVREALRPFVRDGLLEEIEPRSDPSTQAPPGESPGEGWPG